ncbi:hypothetical protein KL950_004485 [Ogataea haglerorum]|nr:hypothetical protein KL950_004485 [Ogataea haglerorum]
MLRLVRPIRRFSFIRPLHNEGSSHHTLRRENGEIKIKVEPLPRINESIEKKRRRLLYQSRKRGILESDLLLSRFADRLGHLLLGN